MPGNVTHDFENRGSERAGVLSPHAGEIRLRWKVCDAGPVGFDSLNRPVAEAPRKDGWDRGLGAESSDAIAAARGMPVPDTDEQVLWLAEVVGRS